MKSVNHCNQGSIGEAIELHAGVCVSRMLDCYAAKSRVKGGVGLGI